MLISCSNTHYKYIISPLAKTDGLPQQMYLGTDTAIDKATLLGFGEDHHFNVSIKFLPDNKLTQKWNASSKLFNNC